MTRCGSNPGGDLSFIRCKELILIAAVLTSEQLVIDS